VDGGWAKWAPLGEPFLGSGHSEAADVAVGPDRLSGLVLLATSPVPAPPSLGSVPWLWLRSQPSPGTDWTDWQSISLSGPSTATKPIEGPVLGRWTIEPVLAVRETGTANIHLAINFQLPGDYTSWSTGYLEFAQM
jgi:hypothetical protein